jgi:hypothetical protein
MAEPLIEKKKISAVQNETGTDKTFLGETLSNGQFFFESDCFFELSGWYTPLSIEDPTPNRYADVGSLPGLYDPRVNTEPALVCQQILVSR